MPSPSVVSLALRVAVLLPMAALAQTPQYIGAGGCSSANCHGSTSRLPETSSRIWGNEYAMWSVPDKHSKAFKALEDARSNRMGQILNIADVRNDQRCTVCHVVGSPARAASDGVSCEGCHGPAERWLGPHTQKNSHAASVAAGMIDTKDPIARAKTCLGCHLGNEQKVVDHELIAAGHPDLAFELDTFTWAQPAHHNEVKAAAGDQMPHVRLWAVGEAVKLAEGMRLLAARAAKSWPEFAELECYGCHHDLRAESWRIARGYPGRRPGSLQFSVARTDVLRVLVAQAAPGQKAALEQGIATLSNTIATRPFESAVIAQAAQSLARQGDALAAEFSKRDFNAAGARELVRALALDAGRLANNGVLSAEQATMALDSLLASLAGDQTKSIEPVSRLYAYLEHPPRISLASSLRCSGKRRITSAMTRPVAICGAVLLLACELCGQRAQLGVRGRVREPGRGIARADPAIAASHARRSYGDTSDIPARSIYSGTAHAAAGRAAQPRSYPSARQVLFPECRSSKFQDVEQIRFRDGSISRVSSPDLHRHSSFPRLSLPSRCRRVGASVFRHGSDTRTKASTRIYAEASGGIRSTSTCSKVICRCSETQLSELHWQQRDGGRYAPHSDAKRAERRAPRRLRILRTRRADISSSELPLQLRSVSGCGRIPSRRRGAARHAGSEHQLPGDKGKRNRAR